MDPARRMQCWIGVTRIEAELIFLKESHKYLENFKIVIKFDFIFLTPFLNFHPSSLANLKKRKENLLCKINFMKVYFYLFKNLN